MIKLTFHRNGRSDDGSVTITLDALLKQYSALGLNADYLTVELVKNGKTLKVSINDDEDYPSVAIDGSDQHDQEVYLAQAELPNEDYPDAFTARLYAGYAACETDEPIAMVKADILSKEQLQERTEAVKQRKKPYLKTLSIDEDLVTIQTFENGGCEG